MSELRRVGWMVNHKWINRFYKLEGLVLRINVPGANGLVLID